MSSILRARKSHQRWTRSSDLQGFAESENHRGCDLKKFLIIGVAVVALGVAAVGVGTGLAQQNSTGSDTFIGKLAAKLGISEDKVKTAVDEAYSETIDEQQAAGQLTQDQADRLKERGFEIGPMFGGGMGRAVE